LRCSLNFRGPCIIALGWEAEFLATILASAGNCSAPRRFLKLSARTAISVHSVTMPGPPS
jgi:hypothetical protein